MCVGNGLFTGRGYPIGDQFLGTLAAQYGAGVHPVDFTSPDTVKMINSWVRQQTADRIPKLFDDLLPDTRLVLANAVYLRADWAQGPNVRRPPAARLEKPGRGAAALCR